MAEFVILDHFKESLWESTDKRFIVEQGGAGSGKALPLDAKVRTPEGYTLMRDLSVGDSVCNAYGGVSEVLEKWENPVKKIYKITLEDGRTVRCSSDHVWVFHVNDGDLKEGTTVELMNHIKIGRRVYLPLTAPVLFEDSSEDVLPYQMGQILGSEGTERAMLQRTIHEYHIENCGFLNRRGKWTEILPKSYLKMSVWDRIDLIRGFYSVAGSYDLYSQNIIIEIKSKVVAKALQSVIWSLGGVCTLRFSASIMKFKLTIDFRDYEIKEDLLDHYIENDLITYTRNTSPNKIEVTSVERDGNEECQCISVNSKDGLFLVEDYIVTHNSAAICQRMCHMFLTQSDMVFAVVRGTRPALIKSVYLGDPSIVKTLESWDIPVHSWLNKTEDTIRNPLNGSVLYFIGLDDPEKIKSMNTNYTFIEEATEISADKWAQLNTRMRRKNPYQKNQMFIAYNPISYYNWAVQMFTVDPDPLVAEDSVVHFSNFSQNPFVELEDVKSWFARASRDENYYRTYIVGIPGKPIGMIYPNIKFKPNETWPKEVWKISPYYGIDWGFVDPTVLVECRNYDKTIYIRCKYYEKGKSMKDFLNFLEREGIPKGSSIFYDPSNPERAMELMKAGYAGFKATRNINAGISFVNGFDIVIDSMGPYAQMAIDEVQAYTWQTDPNDSGKFIEKPTQGDDHFCDAMRYAVVTNYTHDSTLMVGKLDVNIDEALRKSGVYMG